MTTKRIIGIALVILGLGLAWWGHQMSGGLGSQLNQALSGSPTNKVMACYIGGAVAFIVGLLLALKK